MSEVTERGRDCAWCGAETRREAAPDEGVPATLWNERGEPFCSAGHRASSGRALAKFLKSEPGPAEKTSSKRRS